MSTKPYDNLERREMARMDAESRARLSVPPCLDCGAQNAAEAETMCHCAGDKDDCHGCHLWPDAA
jgi:hypothetical protein